MRKLSIVLIFNIMAFLLPFKTEAQGREEFNGPYSSWADVKKRFGARGDGQADDTRALQTAIDSLANPATGQNMGKNAYMVVYLPAGTYCISSTLVLKGKVGISIIGEDPARTVIKWIGNENDTLLWTNGSAYFKISRLTWDANGRKGMEGIGIHWKSVWNDGKTRSFASLNIEISDNNFIGAFSYGLKGGTQGGSDGTGANDSEIAIRRCTFTRCTEAGIGIIGFNALDYWIWDCRFLQCESGIVCGYGGYHVYRSFFSGSHLCDLHNMHGYYNSMRGCYSEKTRQLSTDETVTSNPFKRIFQDNTVINPHIMPIQYYHLGKITLWGNKITAASDTANKFIVNTASWAPGTYEILSLHNIYGYRDPIKIRNTPNRIYSVGDRQANVQASAQAFLSSMDAMPAKVVRKVFEVPLNADGAAIQAILNQAAALKGQRPVVHFGVGAYTIDRPLVIPPGSDMQLTGDGLLFATVILKANGVLFPQKGMILVKGPSYISIRDLQISKDGEKDQLPAIVFEDVDQPGSQAHIDQVYSHADTSLSVKGMDNLYVQKDNSFFMDGNYVSGGPLVQKGGGTAGVFCYGGQFAGVKVEGNGRFLAKDCWWEGNTRVPVNLEGEGTVCIDGAMIAPDHADSNTTIRIGKFNGHISLMNMYIQGALSPMGNNPGLNLFVWNTHYYHKMDVLDFLRKGASYRAAFLGMSVQCFRPNDPACAAIPTIDDRLVNVADANAYIESETAFDRNSRPRLFKNLSPGISNIYISRISILGRRGEGISFTAR